MYNKNDLARIKSELEDKVGSKVTLTAKKGRKKSIIKQGVIESTYSSVFIVRLDITDDQVPSERRVSYNYIDVLTKTVEIMLSDKKIPIAQVV